MSVDKPALRFNPLFGKQMNNSLQSHAVTLRYLTAAHELDKYLNHPGYANWFHYATWGTYNVGEFIRMAPESPMADSLVQGENLIFDSAMKGLAQFVLGGPVDTGEPEVDAAFDHYSKGHYLQATLTLMRHEQSVVQKPLEEAFAAMWPPFTPEALTRYMVINLPNRQLSVSEDVPGFPHTAVKNWLRYEERVKWMEAQEALDLDSKAMIEGSPYN